MKGRRGDYERPDLSQGWDVVRFDNRNLPRRSPFSIAPTLSVVVAERFDVDDVSDGMKRELK